MNSKPMNKTLSQRIVESADPIMAKMHEMPEYAEYLICGTITEESTAFAHRVYREVTDFMKAIPQLLQYGFNKTDSVEDKALFANIISGMDEACNGYTEEFEKLFGKVKNEYMTSPQTQTYHNWMQNAVVITCNGTYLEFLVLFLYNFYTIISDGDFVRSHPNFKPNPFVDLFTFESTGLRPMFAIFCSIIDRLEPISAEEELRAKEIIKRTATYDMAFKEYQYYNKEWSGGLWYQ